MASMPDLRVNLSPSTIASASFTQARRGFDVDEVRSYLRHLADEWARLVETEASLRRELAEATRETPELDEAMVAGMLGEETARVLTTAREAAHTIKARAEENVERLLRSAQEDAARIREEASLDSARQHTEAANEAERVLDSARDEGRRMVAEARAVRERMLSDLQRRREAARRQIAELDTARQQLLELFGSTQRSVAEVLGALGAPAEEAEEAADEDVEAMLAEPAEEVPAAEVVTTEAPVEPPASADDSEAMGAVVLSLVVGEPEPAAPVVADDIVDTVDEAEGVFERLRAEQPEVAQAAQEVASDSGHDVAAAAEPTVLERRDEVLAPVIASLGRRLKRALADEQNGVLDRLRRQGSPTIEGVVGTAGEQAERYRAAVEDDAWAAASAGARSLAALDEDDVHERLEAAHVLDEVLAAVDAGVAGPLRAHLERSLAEAGGDSVEVASRLRATYREWKTQRLDEIATTLGLVAFGAGAFAAVETGTPLHWVGDPTAACADCDDNALAGIVRAGEAFPTGHRHAPAHPGCTCAITTA